MNESVSSTPENASEVIDNWQSDAATAALQTTSMGDFTFRLRLSLSQLAERNLKLNAKVGT